MRKRALQNLVAYMVAAAVVYYAARSVSWSQVVEASNHARIWLFLGVSLGGFLCWFVGETFLYSRLFSYFHGPTRARELLPTMATVYFLQLINSYVAGSAYLLFLHTRKRVPWIMGGCTLLFQAYIDVILLAILSLVAIVFVPTSPIRFGRYYAAGIVVGAGLSYRHVLAFLGRTAESWQLAPMDLRSALDVEFPYGAAFAVCEAGRNQISDFSRSRPHVVRPIGKFSYLCSLAQVLALAPLIVAIGDSPLIARRR